MAKDLHNQFTGFTIQGRSEGSPVREIFDPNEWWRNNTGQNSFISFWAVSREWLEDGNAQTTLDFLRGWEDARDYTLNNIESVIDSYGALAGFNTPEEADALQAEISGGALPNIDVWDQELAENQFQILNNIKDYGFYDSIPSVDNDVVTFSELQDMTETE